MNPFLQYLLIAVIAYLVASFSPGILVSKKMGKIDIREHGSKSTGTTNVMRVMGAKAGIIVAVLDVAKTLVAILIGRYIMANAYPGDAAMYLHGGLVGGLFAVIGHNWPIYHKFYGGKGIACSAAAIVFLFPTWGILALVAGIIILLVTRYVSLGSMSFLLIFTILISIQYISQDILPCLWAALLTILGIYRHRANIQRLIAGNENKIGSKKKK